MQSHTRTCRRLFTSDFSIFFGATDSSSLRCWSRYSSRCDFIAFSWNVVGGMCQEIVEEKRWRHLAVKQQLPLHLELLLEKLLLGCLLVAQLENLRVVI